MRMTSSQECYIDSFSRVRVYMSKNFYGGESRSFHLKDQNSQILPLTIESKQDNGNYLVYNCSIDGPLEVGSDYVLYDEHCRTTPAVYSHIVKTPEFSQRFSYDGDDLGITYTPRKTTFKIWSPVASEAYVVLHNPEGTKLIEMKKNDRGVWSVEIEGNLLHMPYTYQVKVNGKISQIADPYNMFMGVNTSVSYVDDLSLLEMPVKVPVDEMESPVDAIVYEASIRDMTSQNGIGVHHPKTFRGFTEENNITRERQTGFTYLKSLGVTHVQLMPVLDFGSVDEEYPGLFYNWGYDPAHFRALEGSYASNPANPRSRIEEFARLVSNVHKAGMKVNLDVVFNHVWDKDKFGLDVLVPEYYFLMDENGNTSNGSFCGNDVDTRPVMSRKYLLETCRKLIEVYDIDGFRFDLMGILDYSTINEIAEMARSIKPDFMIYGEGWNMPSFVPENLRASMNNQDKMPDTAHFNDRFRDIVKGNNNITEQAGFSNGDVSMIDVAGNAMKACMPEHKFDSPEKSVNYVECHDNMTMYDKNRAVLAGSSRDHLCKRQILANAMVLMAQGIPFLHSGQEFGRTKFSLDNTYNKSDHYNMMDYTRRNEHQSIVDATKKLIEIRKSHPSLRLRTRQEIEEGVVTESIERQCLVYKTAKGDDRLFSFFNPSGRSFEYILPGMGEVLLDSANRNEQRTNKVLIDPAATVIVALD